MTRISRREALLHAGGAFAAPLLVSRADAQVTPGLVRFHAEIEPLVDLIERTPRDKCAEMVVDQLRRGASYRQLMAALFLAGIRNVNPRPPGFAMHCVFVIHSAHLLSLEAPPDARLLPLFYALDNFKAAQQRDAGQAAGDYSMREIRGTLPSGERAASELHAAMDTWDQERAERAVASLARHRSASEVFEMLWRCGARDYRNIGHKAIYVANAVRTLQAIGWQHAEPVLRSVVLGLLDFGREQSVNGYAFEDQCWAGNLKRLKETFPRLNDNWVADRPDAAATRSLLDGLRTATPDAVCADLAARLIKGTITAGAAWDAIHLAAAELRMRARASAVIVSLHAVTAANALRHAFLASTDPQTRWLMLLQAAGWMAQFRTFAQAREDTLRAFAITAIEPASETLPLDQTLAETFAGLPAKVDASASRVFQLARNQPAQRAFQTAAIRLTLAKAEEVHYYKYMAALVEDVPLVSPEWMPHMLAATVYYMRGSADPDSAAMKRAREALKMLTA